jgi:transposase-like protein
MTSILAIFFFWLIRLTVEQKLVEQYCPPPTNFRLPCPRCGFYHTIKNGSFHNGKPKNECKDCGRQFVINPSQRKVSDETKELIDKLLSIP